MGYKSDIKTLARMNHTVFEKGDAIIKYSNRVAEDILNYRNSFENYRGSSTGIIDDNINKIKNSISLLESELDIYKEMLGIADNVSDSKIKRIGKLFKRKNK